MNNRFTEINEMSHDWKEGRNHTLWTGVRYIKYFWVCTRCGMRVLSKLEAGDMSCDEFVAYKIMES